MTMNPWKYTENCINEIVRQLLELAPDISRIAPCTKAVTIPLQVYRKGFSFEPLGEASCKPCYVSKILILNSEAHQKIADTVPSDSLVDALALFGLHEASHVYQGFKEYADVGRMKVITGSELMGQYDLTSDFLAAHTLSLLYTLQKEGVYNEEAYIGNFYKLWCEMGKNLQNIFPAGNKPAKQQRVFGSLLMANLTEVAYLRGHPLAFNSALWPKWSDSLDQLMIFGKNNNIWLLPTSVDPLLMKQILSAISTGNHSDALFLIQEVLRCLPKI
jgi:hypothetical protein